MDSIQSFSANINEPKQKKPKKGAGLGLLTFGLTVVPPFAIVSQMLGNKMIDLSKNLTADEFSQMEKIIAKTMETSGLKNKGVDIIKVTSENKDEVLNIMRNAYKKSFIYKHVPQNIVELQTGRNYMLLKDGLTALYLFPEKKILAPGDGLKLAIPHEMGHAINHNLSKFGKILQKCRTTAILALPILLVALFKNKKAPDEKPKNVFDKITTFIKNHAPALAIAAWLPTICEEGLASIKGVKMIKNTKEITPQLLKKVRISNLLGLSTYVLIALLYGLGIYEASKVKDAVYHKNVEKMNMQ